MDKSVPLGTLQRVVNAHIYAAMARGHLFPTLYPLSVLLLFLSKEVMIDDHLEDALYNSPFDVQIIDVSILL